MSRFHSNFHLFLFRYPYIFGGVFCFLRGLLAETSGNATVLTITGFTVERYLAICHPFLSHTMSKLSRAVKFILLIWLVSTCFPVMYHRKSVNLKAGKSIFTFNRIKKMINKDMQVRRVVKQKGVMMISMADFDLICCYITPNWALIELLCSSWITSIPG